jgi:hypothetical protein
MDGVDGVAREGGGCRTEDVNSRRLSPFERYAPLEHIIAGDGQCDRRRPGAWWIVGSE